MSNLLTSTQEIVKRIGASSGIAEIEGNQIYYEVAGAGLPLVFVHDGLIHRTGFDKQVNFFANKFTVIRFDRPGYGGAPPPVVDYSHVKTLQGIFGFLGLERAILIGGSAGGSIALDFTIAYPSQVAGLILVGASVSGFEFSDHMWYRGWKNQWGDTIEEMIEFWVKDPWLVAEKNQEAKKRLKEILRLHPQNLQHFSVSILEDGQAIRRLDEVKMPTLVMIGEWDIADNHAQAGIMEVGIQDAKRAVVTDSGHLVYMEQSEKFNQIVKKFLEEKGFISKQTEISNK